MNQRIWPVLFVAVVATVQTAVAPGDFTAWSTIVGLILASILLTVSPREPMSAWERATLSQVWALVAIIVLGRVFNPLFSSAGTGWIQPSRLYFLLWVLASALLYWVFRRMGREGS